MCGRFTLTAPEELLAEAFGLDEVPASLGQRYNIAPTQPVAVVRVMPRGPRRLDLLRWGVTPTGPGLTRRGPLINARSEALGRSSSFREAFAERRCLVPADGFFEWTGEAGLRRPFYLRRPDRQPFAFAGLWEPGAREGEPEACVILTTRPNELVRPLHDRMPVILPPDAYGPWLSRDGAAQELRRLCRPSPAGELIAYEVGSAVNNSRVDTPECVAVPRTLFD